MCFGVGLTADQKDGLLARLPVTRAFLDSAVLTRYHKRGLYFTPKGIDDPTVAATSIIYDWAIGTRSNACALCLQETGIWPTRWRLLWSAACRYHKVVLIEKCPDCASPLMSLRRRLDITPGTTHCGCGYDLRLANEMAPSPILLRTQIALDAAMDGHPPALAGDRLDPHAFFVVFKTLAHLIRVTGYDLDGTCWTPNPSRKRQRISTLDLASVTELLERTGRILTLSPERGVTSVDALRQRAADQSIQLAWRFQKAGLERAAIGRIGRVLNT